MTTATASPPLAARELPPLTRVSFPPALATVDGPLGDLARRYREVFGDAVRARAAAVDATQAIDRARDQDAQALTSAALAGEDDPGRVHEMAAVRDHDEAERVAEGLTGAANELAQELRTATRGEPGAALVEQLTARAAKSRVALVRHLDAADAELAELGAVAAFTGWLRKARDGDGRLPSVGMDTPPPVNLGGALYAPVQVVDMLRAYGQEEGDDA